MGNVQEEYNSIWNEAQILEAICRAVLFFYGMSHHQPSNFISSLWRLQHYIQVLGDMEDYTNTILISIF